MKYYIKRIVWILADMILGVLLVGLTYVLNFKIENVKASEKEIVIPTAKQTETVTTETTAKESTKETTAKESAKETTAKETEKPKESLSWKEKFKDKFSDTVISTDTTYRSPDVSVTFSRHSYDSGIEVENYGSMVQYVVADIYISNIGCFTTHFAKDSYGDNITERIDYIAKRTGAVAAINGDFYSRNQKDGTGVIIRNGNVYRSYPIVKDMCVLFSDGTMKVFEKDTITLEQLVERGAFQTWTFGPGLLDENGNAKSKEELSKWDYIAKAHPRSAIGYVEPGHYIFVAVDGRLPGYSRGAFLNELADIFVQYKAKAAYNLDGGHQSYILKGTEYMNKTSEGTGIPVNDGIFIVDNRDK